MTVTTDHGEWHLEGCCNTNEIIFIALYFAYGVLIHCLFHRTDLLYPFKLLAGTYNTASRGNIALLLYGRIF